jgi:hypothetical protein
MVSRLNIFIASLGAIALLMLVVSFIIDGNWWSNLLLQIGSSVILLVPFAWITKWVERQVEASEVRTQAAVSELSREVERTQTDLARTTAEITTLISERFSSERDKDRKLFSAVSTAPSREDIIRALQRASELKIISTFGVRVPLERTGLYLLFPPCVDTGLSVNPALEIRLQTRELKEVMRVDWDPGVSPVDFLHDLGVRLRDTDYWYGDESYAPGKTLETLSSILELGLLAIIEGYPESLNQIFELVEDGHPDDRWVVTETAVVNPKYRYQVAYHRLNEIDWNRHIGAKGWVNKNVFEEALDVGVFLVRDKYVEGVLPSYLPGLWQSPGRDKATETDRQNKP